LDIATGRYMRIRLDTSQCPLEDRRPRSMPPRSPTSDEDEIYVSHDAWMIFVAPTSPPQIPHRFRTGCRSHFGGSAQVLETGGRERDYSALRASPLRGRPPDVRLTNTSGRKATRTRGMAHAERLTLRALSLSSCGRDTRVDLCRVTARAELILAAERGITRRYAPRPFGAALRMLD